MTDDEATNQSSKESIHFFRIMHRILALKARKDGVHAITFAIIQWPIWRRRHVQTLHPSTQCDEGGGYAAPCCSTELVILLFAAFRTAWALIEKVTDVTRRYFDRASDTIAMLMSVFLVISVIAVSNALCRKFAQTGNGASWMIFPSASCTDSSPSTFRSCSREMSLVPVSTYFFAQPYRRIEYWLRSPRLAGFWETYSGSRFFASSQIRSKLGLNVK
jgi:hypothetical protein